LTRTAAIKGKLEADAMLGTDGGGGVTAPLGQRAGLHDVASLLSDRIAARILNRLVASLDKHISVAGPTGRTLVSSDPQRVGQRHPLALGALRGGAVVERGEPDPGVSVPLVFEDEFVGALVLHGDPSHGREIIGVVKTLAELLIHQVYIVEQVPRQEQLRSRFISDLLHGRAQAENGDPPREAAIFGIDLGRPRVVVVVGIGDVLKRLADGAAGASSVPVVAQTHRLQRSRADLIRRAFETSGSPDTDAWGIVDDRWLALLAAFDPARAEQERERLIRRVDRFVGELVGSSGLDICAGIGRYHAGWPGLVQSFADATCAADAGTRLVGPNRVYGLRDLGIAAFLTGASMSAKHELARSLLRPLDREPELLATIDAFLQHNLSPSATVGELNIHRHTLAYRLEKVTHLIGLDPRRFQDAAQISAALLLQRMSDVTACER
jgi:carbohydrate diacid regulator